MGRAGAASLPDFLEGVVITDEVPQTDRILTPKCRLSYLSSDGQFERDICQHSHRGFWGNAVVTQSGESIVSLKTGKQVGFINEPTDSVRSRFASLNGREYLLLMEGGTRLIVYVIRE